jgi:RNA polymerase sigma-70 factor (ECF subfamily)
MNKIEFFKILFNTHYEKVYRTTYLIIQNEFIARDATQEAFIIAYKQLDNLKDLDNMYSWLTVVASNQAKNTIKKNANCIPIADINELENKLAYSPNVIEQKNKEIDLTKALNTIKVKYREVLVFKYYLDLSDQEIADMLELPLGTIKSRISRAKMILKDILESQNESGVV